MAAGCVASFAEPEMGTENQRTGPSLFHWLWIKSAGPAVVYGEEETTASKSLGLTVLAAPSMPNVDRSAGYP